jgi:hypothetical protein
MTARRAIPLLVMVELRRQNQQEVKEDGPIPDYRRWRDFVSTFACVSVKCFRPKCESVRTPVYELTAEQEDYRNSYRDENQRGHP